MTESNDASSEETNTLVLYYTCKYLFYGVEDKSDVTNDEIQITAQTNSSHISSPTKNDNSKNVEASKVPTFRDWNAEFQNYVDQANNFDERTESLGNFGREFVREVSETAQKIIDEFSIQDELQKTVLPCNLGGIAGGTKYIRPIYVLISRYLHNGVVYKVAVDDSGLYGSDESVHKVAGHEIRGGIWCHVEGVTDTLSQSLINLQTKDTPHLPLSCLIDYCGVRIVAIAQLPISKDTLVCGSHNAGYTIHNENHPQFARGKEMMINSLCYLYLKPHNVIERSTNISKQVYGPVDMELHYGKDGRFYVIDTARLMPPVSPSSFKKKRKVSYLVNLFRPELMQIMGIDLNADAYSPFSKEGRDEIDKATFEVLFSRMTGWANLLDNLYAKYGEPKSKILLDMDIKTIFHAQGFNLRYLGRVYAELKTTEIRQRYLTEMVMRVLKDEIKRKLRSAVIYSYQAVIEATTEFFNMAFDTNNFSRAFWQTIVKELLQQKYDEPLSNSEMEENFAIRSQVDLERVFIGIQNQVGIYVRSKNPPTESTTDSSNCNDNNETISDWQSYFPLSPEQVHMGVVVKHRAFLAEQYASKLREQGKAISKIKELKNLGKWMTASLASTMLNSALSLSSVILEKDHHKRRLARRKGKLIKIEQEKYFYPQDN